MSCDYIDINRFRCKDCSRNFHDLYCEQVPEIWALEIEGSLHFNTLFESEAEATSKIRDSFDKEDIPKYRAVQLIEKTS